MIKKIGDLDLYVGTKDEYHLARALRMAIVCAMNVGEGVSYRSVFGKTTPDDPNYLYGQVGDDQLFLNLIDGKDPKYISEEIITTAMAFIKHQLLVKKKVFIYCSEGKSRSPSIAFMYMLLEKILPAKESSFAEFTKLYYPNYQPGEGIKQWILKNYFG